MKGECVRTEGDSGRVTAPTEGPKSTDTRSKMCRWQVSTLQWFLNAYNVIFLVSLFIIDMIFLFSFSLPIHRVGIDPVKGTVL